MEYFASKDASEIGLFLVEKVQTYYNFLEKSGYLNRIRKAYATYYGINTNQGNSSLSVERGGSQGELTLLNVNHYRNLCEHLKNLTTSQRSAMECRGINTDFKTQAQVQLATGILDYYMREKRLEQQLIQAAEYSIVLSEGSILAEWDATTGEIYSYNPDTKAPIYEGDLKYSTLSILDLIRDPYQKGNSNTWNIVRTFENKWDLAAKYPELKDSIESQSNYFKSNDRFELDVDRASEDEIPVYTFFHKLSESVPNGRQTVFIGSGDVLLDGPLPYREVPIYRMSGSQIFGSPFGYTNTFDLLGIQDAVSSLYSTILTNQSTFGVQNILVPKGHDLSIEQVSTGLNLIEYDKDLGAPTPLNLTQTPPEIFRFIQMLESSMETLSGVNSVARGNPEASLKSGAALALVQSQAIQFASGLARSYNSLLENVGTATIKTLQDFATVPRVAVIVGQSNRAYMKEFKGVDIGEVNRVVVDSSNALTKTVAGKLEIANNLLQTGLLKTPENYLQVLKTGQLDILLEGQSAELMLIKSENEVLTSGENPPVTAIDSHVLHVKEHKHVLSTPQARQDPVVVAAALQHINEHINLLRSVDPTLLKILGEEPAPQANQAPQPVPQNLDQVVSTVDPLERDMPNMPRMPVPPRTGN